MSVLVEEEGDMLYDLSLSLDEYVRSEPMPNMSLFQVVFEVLKGRRDVAVFGGQAVNVYVQPPRATEDVDVLACDPEALAEEIARAIGARFHIAVRVRVVKDGLGYRVYQAKGDGKRHLVDVRGVVGMPAVVEKRGIQVVAPIVLVAMKVRSIAGRGNSPKKFTDQADLHRLLGKFPQFRTQVGSNDVCAVGRFSPKEMSVWVSEVSRVYVDEDDDA